MMLFAAGKVANVVLGSIRQDIISGEFYESACILYLPLTSQ